MVFFPSCNLDKILHDSVSTYLPLRKKIFIDLGPQIAENKCRCPNGFLSPRPLFCKFLRFLKIFLQLLVHSNSFLKFITNSYQFIYIFLQYLTISDQFLQFLTNFNICLQSLILSYNSLLFLSIAFLMNSYKFLYILTTSSNSYNILQFLINS